MSLVVDHDSHSIRRLTDGKQLSDGKYCFLSICFRIGRGRNQLVEKSEK